MSSRILILTAGFGEGHNAAARAVALAWDEVHGSGSAHVADVFALAAPRLNGVFRRGYLGLINRAPHLWSATYRWLDRSIVLPRVLRSMRRQIRVLATLIRREEPAAICCTFPAYAFMLDALAQQQQVTVPFFNVVTDSISINSLWWRAGAAGWFLPNDDSADVLRQAGIEQDRLHVTGFPVRPFFEINTGRLSPPDPAKGAIPRILCIINSNTRAAAETARRLLRETPWEITCTVGRNDALRRELESLAGRRAPGAKILGWTDEIPQLLMTHHVVVSKAGGATTQEAIAACCPMIVNQVVPGQEEGNYELLRRHGIGALAQTPGQVIAELQRAFANECLVWREWRAAIAPLSRPRAAKDIAAAIFIHLAAREIPEPIPLPFRRTNAASA
jgi:processive 1,2-diacylglycerol beta-glucosyltransferase